MAAETRPDGETTGRGHSLCQQSADVCVLPIAVCLRIVLRLS